LGNKPLFGLFPKFYSKFKFFKGKELLGNWAPFLGINFSSKKVLYPSSSQLFSMVFNPFWHLELGIRFGVRKVLKGIRCQITFY